MALIGKSRNFYDKFKFIVEIDGVAYAGFSKCSELSVEVEKIEHREGGGALAHKSPGNITVPDLTLERGATDDLDLYNWFEQVAKVAAGLGGAGLIDDQYKRNFDVVQLNRDDSVRQRWACTGGWPSKFVAGEWDAGGSEKVIEKVTLVIDYFVPTIRR